jgi:hypothetical protein
MGSPTVAELTTRRPPLRETLHIAIRIADAIAAGHSVAPGRMVFCYGDLIGNIRLEEKMP